MRGKSRGGGGVQMWKRVVSHMRELVIRFCFDSRGNIQHCRDSTSLDSFKKIKATTNSESVLPRRNQRKTKLSKRQTNESLGAPGYIKNVCGNHPLEPMLETAVLSSQ